METTRIFKENLKAYTEGYRVIENRGGTSSTKTYSILQLLIVLALYSETPLIISVVNETMPQLKRGALRDFEIILKNEGHYSESMHNKSDNIFTLNKGMVEFFSADQEERVRGPRRDILFLPECYNLRYKTYQDLVIRTRRTIFTDYNPIGRFWMQKKGISEDKDTKTIISTYKDNPFLEQPIIDDIEKNYQKYLKEKKAGIVGEHTYWWKVFGLGEVGIMLEKRIFKYITLIDKIPETAHRIPSGMDFGLSPDPSTLVDMYIQGEDLYLDERLYETNLVNVKIQGAKRLSIQDRLELMKFDKGHTIVADSAENKSIIELKYCGYNVYAVRKFPGSVIEGIKILLSYNIHITRSSINAINEFENYMYKVDRNDEIIPEPANNQKDHIIDPVRYVMLMKNRLWYEKKAA